MRNRKQEKPKDLVGTWKKLLGYCRKYLVILVIALVCAAAGTVCTLVGPDKYDGCRYFRYFSGYG